MTQEEKAKRYDEAIKLAKDSFSYPDYPGFIRADVVFPELKESEDERIRKEIIEMLRSWASAHYITKEKFSERMAWLEKQGEQSIYNVPSREIILAIWDLGNEWKELTNGSISTEFGTQLNYIQKHWEESEYYLRKKQDEQKPQGKSALEAIKEEKVDNQNCVKPIDKVEPRFHVGNWITNGEYTWKVISVDYLDYTLQNQCGECVYDTVDYVNKAFHLWTIQDAKDGDVLVDEDNNIGIFQKCEGKYWYSYIYLGCDGKLRGFSIGGCHRQTDTQPATKEQRDLLFQKIKETGYEWDANKKELRKKEVK